MLGGASQGDVTKLTMEGERPGVAETGEGARCSTEEATGGYVAPLDNVYLSIFTDFTTTSLLGRSPCRLRGTLEIFSTTS